MIIDDESDEQTICDINKVYAENECFSEVKLFFLNLYHIRIVQIV